MNSSFLAFEPLLYLSKLCWNASSEVYSLNSFLLFHSRVTSTVLKAHYTVQTQSIQGALWS